MYNVMGAEEKRVNQRIISRKLCFTNFEPGLNKQDEDILTKANVSRSS